MPLFIHRVAQSASQRVKTKKYNKHSPSHIRICAQWYTHTHTHKPRSSGYETNSFPLGPELHVSARLVLTVMWHRAESAGMKRTWALERLWTHGGGSNLLVRASQHWGCLGQIFIASYYLEPQDPYYLTWSFKARMDLSTLSTFNLLYSVSTTANLIQAFRWASLGLHARIYYTYSEEKRSKTIPSENLYY